MDVCGEPEEATQCILESLENASILTLTQLLGHVRDAKLARTGSTTYITTGMVSVNGQRHKNEQARPEKVTTLVAADEKPQVNPQRVYRELQWMANWALMTN